MEELFWTTLPYPAEQGYQARQGQWTVTGQSTGKDLLTGQVDVEWGSRVEMNIRCVYDRDGTGLVNLEVSPMPWRLNLTITTRMVSADDFDWRSLLKTKFTNDTAIV